MAYGHYVVMGGFAADVEDIHNVAKRVSITPTGVVMLAMAGYFCQISERQIQDRSKTDILAKGLVCLQVLWVAGQAVERKLVSFPTSLLEIHTLVHVACALIMYILWAQKPQNVQDPSMIRDKRNIEMLAFFLERSQGSFPVNYRNYRGFLQTGPDKVEMETSQPECLMAFVKQETKEVAGCNLSDNPTAAASMCSTICIDGHEVAQVLRWYGPAIPMQEGAPKLHVTESELHCLWKTYVPVREQAICSMVSGEVLNFPNHISTWKIGPDLPLTITYGRPEYEPVTLLRQRMQSLESSIKISLSRKDFRRLSLMSKSRWVKEHEGSSALFQDHSKTTQAEGRWIDYLGSFRHRLTHPPCRREPEMSVWIPNWVGSEFAFDRGIWFHLFVFLLPIMYGCIHLETLTFSFPTRIEQLIWKISCFILIACGTCLEALSMVMCLDRSLRFLWEDRFLWQDRLERNDSPRPANDLEDNVSAERCTRERIRIGHALLNAWHNSSLEKLCYFISPPQLMSLDYRPRPFRLNNWIRIVILSSIVLVYCFARVYIVIESFISLRHVPIGVYQTPSLDFMSYIPHL